MAGKVEGTIPLRGGAGVLPALLVYWSGRTGGPIALYLLAIFISFQLFLHLLFVYPFTPISTSSPFPSLSGTTFYLWTLAILAKKVVPRYFSFPPATLYTSSDKNGQYYCDRVSFEGADHEG